MGAEGERYGHHSPFHECPSERRESWGDGRGNRSHQIRRFLGGVASEGFVGEVGCEKEPRGAREASQVMDMAPRDLGHPELPLFFFWACDPSWKSHSIALPGHPAVLALQLPHTRKSLNSGIREAGHRPQPGSLLFDQNPVKGRVR